MTAAPSSLHRRLPHYAPARAAFQTAALGLFNAGEAGGLRLAARIADPADRATACGWIRFEAGDAEVAIAPLIADGLLASIATDGGQPDGVAAAALLARIEPLVAGIETALGRPLLPSGLAGTMSPDWLTLRLDALLPGGAARHRLLLALPDGLMLARPPAPVPVPARLRLPWRALLDGPRIARGRLGSVGRGDLLLLGTGPFPARLSLPGLAGARVDLARREVLILSDTELETGMTSIGDDTLTAGPAAALAQLAVPIRIELDGGSLSAGVLGGLTEGSILPLAATGDTLPVRLRAGDMLWADGTLVAVGDGYGVLIETARAEAS